VKALLDQDWIKVTNFNNSKNKPADAYLLTPSGVEAKTRITAGFLKRKIAEYELRKQEIDRLQADVEPAKDTAVGLADNAYGDQRRSSAIRGSRPRCGAAPTGYTGLAEFRHQPPGTCAKPALRRDRARVSW